MTRGRLLTGSLVLIALLCAGRTSAQVHARSSVLASGAVAAKSGNTLVSGTFGQPAIGIASGAAGQAREGFWYTAPQPVEGITHEPTSPAGYALYQNFPNPFNPATTIRFDVPEKSRVKLTVFSPGGEVAAMLIDETLEQGTHAISFLASQLASGAYYYRLEAGSFVQTKRMVLMK
jgi:hypothetical protein